MDATIDLKDKTILVTGGSGYLGQKFIEKLLEMEAMVHCIDIIDNFKRKNVSYHKVDLLNIEDLNDIVKKINPTIIYHLAASLNRTRDFSEANTLLAINLTGTVNLLNAIRECAYNNFVFVSTSEVYGGNTIKAPFKEEDNFIPASPYSLSKYCAEMSLKTYSKIYSKNFTILRLFNFYGSNMPKNFFLPQLTNKLKRNEDFDMTNGEQIRDFLHIEDVIEAMILSTSIKAYNETFNVCSGKGESIKEIAIKIRKHLNSKSKINFGALPYQGNEIWDMRGNNDKIKNLLRWQPKISLKEGINKITFFK